MPVLYSEPCHSLCAPYQALHKPVLDLISNPLPLLPVSGSSGACQECLPLGLCTGNPSACSPDTLMPHSFISFTSLLCVIPSGRFSLPFPCCALLSNTYFHPNWVYSVTAKNCNSGHAATAKPLAHPTNKGEECYFMEKKGEWRGAVLKVSLLEKSSSG